MPFSDIATRVARAALSIEEPPRAVDDLVESLLMCHADGDRVARMRFMECLVERIFPEEGAPEDFALLVTTRSERRKREALRRKAIARLRLSPLPEASEGALTRLRAGRVRRYARDAGPAGVPGGKADDQEG